MDAYTKIWIDIKRKKIVKFLRGIPDIRDINEPWSGTFTIIDKRGEERSRIIGYWICTSSKAERYAWRPVPEREPLFTDAFRIELPIEIARMERKRRKKQRMSMSCDLMFWAGGVRSGIASGRCLPLELAHYITLYVI